MGILICCIGMKRTFPLVIYILYFLYFVSFLIARPGFERVSPQSSDPLKMEQTASGGEQRNELNTFKDFRYTFKAGLLERVLLQKETLARIYDPLLESDSKPDQLFRTMERSYSGDLFLLVLDIFWSSAFLFLIFIFYKGEWFSRNMSILLLVPSQAVLLLVLFIFRRGELFLIRGFSPPLFLTLLFEGALFLAGVTLLFQNFLSQQERSSTAASFMSHLDGGHLRLGKTLHHTGVIFSHMVFIALVALLLSNLILLPVFKLQLNFPGFFALLIMAGLVALALFYVIAYHRVARFQNIESDYLTSLSFLSYRMLKNTLFLTGTLLLIFVVIGAILMLVLFNINILYQTGVLTQSGTL